MLLNVHMCGIIGYSGNMEAKHILMKGLESLEYRGYDSSGIAFFNKHNDIKIIKTVGKVRELAKLINKDLESTTCGIGHTRWATHGNVSYENAHPHKYKKICLVHNGIIENYQDLIKKYNIKDEDRKGSTDTEIAAIVLNHIYENVKDPLKAISLLTEEIVGAYSFAILFLDLPNEIYAINKMAPLVCAKTDIGTMLSSDLTSLLAYTKNYFIIKEHTIVKLTNYDIFAFDATTLLSTTLEEQFINFNPDSALKGGFPHFMLKEIYDQPTSIYDSIIDFIKDDIPDFSSILDEKLFEKIERINIIACGTSRHAGLVASQSFIPIIKIPINVYVASEYRYSEPLINENDLYIFVSQSGETIDTLSSLRMVSRFSNKTLSIVNVKNSILARETTYTLNTNAGPEIAVASTKAYTVQIAMLYLLFSKIAFVKGQLSYEELKIFTKNLLDVPNVVKDTLLMSDKIREIAKVLKYHQNCFYIGRLQDYISSLEGALKLKEVSYINTDAYAAGELKHGTIALISDGVPVIAIDTVAKTSDKLLSNVEEVKARNAFVILIINEDFNYNHHIANAVLTIKNVSAIFSVFPVSVITQLIAYYTSLEKGLDVDKPRNLAKSVTVE